MCLSRNAGLEMLLEIFLIFTEVIGCLNGTKNIISLHKVRNVLRKAKRRLNGMVVSYFKDGIHVPLEAIKWKK